MPEIQICLKSELYYMFIFQTENVRNPDITCTKVMLYSECLNTEQPKSKLRRNLIRREFGFQTTFWSFKLKATSSDWFLAICRPHLVGDFIARISDSVLNWNCLGMELKPAVWIPNQYRIRTFTVHETQYEL